MAEALAVIGVVASIIQLVDFITKVSKHLNDVLDNANEVPEMFQEVKLQLPLLIETLHRTRFHVDHGRYNGQMEAALQALVEGCNTQMTSLNNILNKATPQGHDSAMTKGRKAVYSVRHEKLVTRIKMKLSSYIEKLVLFHCTVGPDYIVSTIKDMLRHKNEFQRPEEMMSGANKPDTFQRGYEALHKGVERSNKGATGCISTFDHRRRHFQTFIVLARVSIPWCLKASLDLRWGYGCYSIAPALELERIVKYTSPGYEIFWKCEIGILDLPSGLLQLDRLFRAGRASPLDIDPGGATWLEKLLHNPLRANYEVRVAFLKKLMEFGAPLNTNKLLMSLCAKWTGMGPHMALLKEILALSTNVLEDSRHDTKHWPLPIPIWRMIPHANDIPDPFLLHFFRECSKTAFGFCNQTPLMDAILSGSTDEVIRCLQNTQSLVEKNLRGQSAVHFAAALSTTKLQLLLDTDVELDMQDNQGISPLDYAAAYGCTQSVVSLLEAGAHPLRKDEAGSMHISFFVYAADWDHWEVIALALSFLQASTCYSPKFLLSELDHLLATFGDDGMTERSKGMEHLFELGADPNLVLQNGDYILHRVRSLTETKVLLKAGIKNIDNPDSQGANPLMSLLRFRGLDLFNFLLERGANANHGDRHGRSALHIMCHTIQSHRRYETLNELRIQSDAIIKTMSLLRYGADPLKRDDCLCACSYYGCSASTVLAGPGNIDSEGDVWCLEWLLMIKERRGTEVAQRALMDLVRVKEFDTLGMTHVCCNRWTSRHAFPGPMEDEEAHEILEEERFLKQALEDFMEAFSKSQGDSIEETWIKLLSRYFRLPEQQPIENWTWGVWDGEGSERCWNWVSPPPWRLLSAAEKLDASDVATPFQLVPHRYYIDVPTDTFREDCGSETSSTFSYSELYRIWVKHFNDEKSAAHIASNLVEASWYENRKYWAARQAHVIEAVRRKEMEIGGGSIKEMERDYGHSGFG